MANRVPLIVDTSTLNIKELPASDNLDLSSSGLLGVTKIGINTAATKNTLEVIGNANISGIVTATTFIGNVTGTITGNATGLTGEPDIIVRNVRATGITTYEDTRNVDSIGIITARSDVHVGAGLSVIGISTFTGAIDANGNIDIAGNTVLSTSSLQFNCCAALKVQIDIFAEDESISRCPAPKEFLGALFLSLYFFLGGPKKKFSLD